MKSGGVAQKLKVAAVGAPSVFSSPVRFLYYLYCIDSQTHSQDVLTAASKMLKHKYGFAHTTLQVEKYQDEMGSCGPCQGSGTNKNDESQQKLSPL